MASLPRPSGSGPTAYSLHGGLSQWLYVSPEVVDVTGWTPEELVGNSAAETIAPDDAHVMLAAYQAGVESGEPIRMRYRSRCADGTLRWLELTGRSLRDEDQMRLVMAVRRTSAPDDGRAWWRLEPGQEGS